MFSTAYFGLLRVGEMCAGSHPILVNDVHIAENKKKFMFLLRSSKTHGKYNKPQQVKITSTKLRKEIGQSLKKTVAAAHLEKRQEY